MMGKRLLSLVMALTALAAHAADTTAEKLPVRRVVLYKNGVGYFEHTGRVRGAQELKVDFTSAQLNDVLKSLTVLDLSGGKISGVGYNSVAPIAEQLKRGARLLVRAPEDRREHEDRHDHHDQQEARAATRVQSRVQRRALGHQLVLGLEARDRLVLGAVVLEHPA